MIATRKPRANSARKPVDLAKSLDALHDFQDNPKNHGLHPDKGLPGLALFIGPRAMVWRYQKRTMVKGHRKLTFKTLGEYPAVSVEAARSAAISFAGSVVDGKAAPGKREATKFGEAFERYLAHLKKQAEDKGKPPRWHDNARKLYEGHIKPQWAHWTLYDMSQQPRAVLGWYSKLARTIPTTADHCARLIRACYKEEARLDRTLPAALPTSGIRFKKIVVQEQAMPSSQFGAWRKAWDKIESPVRRGYHLANLLTGLRPGELAMVRKDGWDRKAHTLTLKNIKSKPGEPVRDVTVPITPQIEYALQMAIDAPPQVIVQRGLRGMRKGEKRSVARRRSDAELIFPGCAQASAHSELPFAGRKLRHSYKTLATAMGLPDVVSAVLIGHKAAGSTVIAISGTYIGEDALRASPEARTVQERMSARIFELLGLELDSPPLVPEQGAGGRKLGKARKPERAAGRR